MFLYVEGPLPSLSTFLAEQCLYVPYNLHSRDLVVFVLLHLPTNRLAVKVELAVSLLTCHTASSQTKIQTWSPLSCYVVVLNAFTKTHNFNLIAHEIVVGLIVTIISANVSTSIQLACFYI